MTFPIYLTIPAWELITSLQKRFDDLNITHHHTGVTRCVWSGRFRQPIRYEGTDISVGLSHCWTSQQNGIKTEERSNTVCLRSLFCTQGPIRGKVGTS